MVVARHIIKYHPPPPPPPPLRELPYEWKRFYVCVPPGTGTNIGVERMPATGTVARLENPTGLYLS